jgi:hypothetical protein
MEVLIQTDSEIGPLTPSKSRILLADPLLERPREGGGGGTFDFFEFYCHFFF